MKKHLLEINSDGTRTYYIDGTSIIDQEGGPAVILTDGSKYWYRDGKLHNEDGPAIEYSDGSKSWYIDDALLSEQQFLQYRLDKHIADGSAHKIQNIIEVTFEDIAAKFNTTSDKIRIKK